jgi:hypothetical protein
MQKLSNKLKMYAWEDAKELNRSLLSELRRVERRTRLRAANETSVCDAYFKLASRW